MSAPKNAVELLGELLKVHYPDMEETRLNEMKYKLGAFDLGYRLRSELIFNPAGTEVETRKFAQLLLNKVSSSSVEQLEEAFSTLNNDYTRSCRRSVFGNSQKWRDHLLSEQAHKVFLITESWTEDGKYAALLYTPRYIASGVKPVEKYIRKAKTGIMVLKEINFELKTLLKRDVGHSKPTIAERTESVFGNIADTTLFSNGVLKIKSSDAHMVVSYDVIESTDKQSIVDVYASAQKFAQKADAEDEPIIGDTAKVDKLSKRYTIRTNAKGKNTQSVKEIPESPWMAQAFTFRDHVKNPNNTLMHPHIKEDAKYEGEYIWVCSNDSVFVKGFGDTWWPLDGGLKVLDALVEGMEASYRNEYEKFKLVERLMK